MTRGFLRFTRESLVRLLLAGVFCLGPWAAFAACTAPEADDGTPFARVQLTPNAILFFKVLADPVEVGEAFDMVVRVCKGDPLASGATITANAVMPGHGHGMNYAIPSGKFSGTSVRLESFVFHMPGDWQFQFAVRHRGTTYRGTADYHLGL